jgi:hypothetical protein
MTDPTNKKKASRGRPFQSETLQQISIRVRPEDAAWLKADRAHLEQLRAWLRSKVDH